MRNAKDKYCSYIFCLSFDILANIIVKDEQDEFNQTKYMYVLYLGSLYVVGKFSCGKQGFNSFS